MQDHADLEGLVAGMRTRLDAHRASLDVHGSSGPWTYTASCSCGWRTHTATDSVRPQWAAIDEHLVKEMLPDWPTSVCWCGRTIMLSPLGVWFHVHMLVSYGHRANPGRDANRQLDEQGKAC
jgi:hypothetical protein